MKEKWVINRKQVNKMINLAQERQKFSVKDLLSFEMQKLLLINIVEQKRQVQNKFEEIKKKSN